ncbi:uncharacterized protein LOC110446057 [Mizuhopecten yessoensis]|uniref:uncharacterized protein LOC110446057 n=1 Tax=Mizuhopecten yessoensis TaxID=6573 RepID=UPI000B45B544|nr:uncharacterized protein LOC110446057 [Mizuhopecten yessoensis]
MAMIIAKMMMMMIMTMMAMEVMGKNCAKTGQILRCHRYEKKILRAGVRIIHLGESADEEGLKELRDVNRLQIEHTTMTCSDFLHRDIIEVILNGVRCQRTLMITVTQHETSTKEQLNVTNAVVEIGLVGIVVLLFLTILFPIQNLDEVQHVHIPAHQHIPRRSQRIRREPVRYGY